MYKSQKEQLLLSRCVYGAMHVVVVAYNKWEEHCMRSETETNTEATALITCGQLLAATCTGATSKCWWRMHSSRHWPLLVMHQMVSVPLLLGNPLRHHARDAPSHKPHERCRN